MTFCFRPLHEDDAPALQELLEASPEYTRRALGREVRAGDGAQLLSARPPEAAPDAKQVLGLFTGSEHDLIGVLDTVRHWPEEGTVHIGLLLIRQDLHGQGLGRMLHDVMIAQLMTDRSLRTLHLNVVSTNSDIADGFWRARGYRSTGEPKPFLDGAPGATTTVWRRSLRPGPPPASGFHHLELWTADLPANEEGWDWLLTALGWRAERVDGWELGRIWRHSNGAYIVLEQSLDGHGSHADRRLPGMNHVALQISDSAALDALRVRAGAHGWRELFADRYPHAGGTDHIAWYGESPDGVEVEVVVTA